MSADHGLTDAPPTGRRADMVLTGGTLVDGTGAPARPADVEVTGARISAVRPPGAGRAARVLDVTGRVICPGFVDVHSHSDLALLANPKAHSKVRQGVTTEIVGNCGLGVTPAADQKALRAAVAFIDLDPALPWPKGGTAGHLRALEAAAPSLNVATLTGHLPLRASAVGFANRPATPAELGTMREELARSLEEGALGLSTGLIYAPASYATEAELTALAEVVAEAGGVFAWHLRDYTDTLTESVAQAVRVAEATGCVTQISHLAAVGRRNWGAVAKALDLIADAPVHVDVYPYLAGSANLSQLLPGWAHEGGRTQERLAEPGARDRVLAGWEGRWWDWPDILVDGHPLESGEQALDLIAEHGNTVTMVAFGRCEEDLLTVLRHPATMIGSDGFALDPAGLTGGATPHPRSYGCYPRLLARYVHEGALTLEEAVRKSTGLPAEVFGLDGRGLIEEGAAADVLVLDPGTLNDLSTFDRPHQFPSGVELVLVNGVAVVESTGHTGAGPGQVLRARGQIGVSA
ncbi:N-acyl-D-amino-acid deacylase family protein [Nonomuraea endophytica]|uniref:N-acyl-D-amino-acid deacylase n=1 Tax=Nonomuraea endophytica TaxID=714136 RepID=A0A7W8ABF3_9ACTN|nr:D-aminoacylase [Nonomuraea endophytica]MBB5082115.1 N-acyl-D-amino-acid deacylase [Nonomuraea endophytica]